MEESKEVIVQECELTEMISINVICRLCANQNDKLIGIYSEDGINNDLANKMNMYLPVKVAETDDLPLQCCWQCASTVLAWHDLVLSSVEADRRLRNCEFITTKVVSQDEDEQMDAASDTTIQEDCEADLSLEETVTEELVESSSTLNAFCQNDIPEIIPTSDGTFIEQKEDISPVPLEDGEGDDDTKYIIDNAEINIKEEENSKCTKGDSSETTTMFCCEVCPMVFAIEEDIIKHIDDRHTNQNGDYVKKEVSMTQDSRKERRRNTKIDQDLVNAAKVVVDNRVYYNCKECGKSLHSPYTYVWHMRIHTGERPFVCDLCGKQFRVSQGLVRHLKETHQRIKNFACDLCGRMFATRRNVEEHRRIHTNERPYICDLCGKAFKQKASLFVHNRSHSDHYPYQCTYCSQAFRTKPPLLIHITKHTGEKPYPCDICGRRFRIKYELKRHRLIHFDEKPFSCEDCGVSFRQKRYLRNHNKLNHQLKSNNLYAVEDHIDQSLSHKQQNICKDEQSGNIKTESNTLSGAENLSGTKPETVIKRGRRKLQIESKTQTKLKQDPRNKDNQSDLAASFNNSVNLDSLTCLLCITSYKNKLLLKAHMKTIHNLTAKKNRRKKTDIELKFFCTVCNTGFTRKYDMEKHMSYKHLLPKKPQSNAKPNSEIIKSCTVLEEGITMYQCDICHQKFSRSFCLIRHRRIHSGDKPYCCHICGKNFRVGNGLTRHINEHHNKLQKFACSICEKKFVSRHSRDEHMNIHTNNRPFICDFCGKAFKQSASLHTHKLFHGDNFRFQCNICSKKFRRARELKVHMWMHTGEKPYSCDVCGNAFRLSQDLKRHLKKHERSSACLCSVCGSEFTQERYLKIHLKTHGPFRTE